MFCTDKMASAEVIAGTMSEAQPAIVDMRYVRVRIESCDPDGRVFHHALKTVLVGVPNNVRDCVRDAAKDNVVRILGIDRFEYEIDEHRSKFKIAEQYGRPDYLYLVVLYDIYGARDVQEKIEEFSRSRGFSQHDPKSIDLTRE